MGAHAIAMARKLAAAAPPQQQLTHAGTTPELAVPAGAPPQQEQQLAPSTLLRRSRAAGNALAPAATPKANSGATHNSVAKRASAARLACGEIA
ncbi:hypothetical protein HaLaN_22440 [Haematococcus lacustris]|uniref:Uncharacterized protein n=1 Tax=Haematococcus lacustris TaxID=44745 RepID=A0A699ZPJ7_HAELA|nr:hypothetical protein HaLaN_22440 [Haematococcus lacustris]